MPLSLVENLQREELSHAERILALDQLAELTRVKGVRRTARALHITAGWLSTQLAVRRDPVLFPALEAGDITFGQAAELVRAPAALRPLLLQRVRTYTGRITTALIRKWIANSRSVVPTTAHAPTRYETVLQRMLQLETPRSAEDVVALRQIALRAKQLLAGATGPSPRVEPFRKISRTELQCLLCGEVAGAIEQGRSFRPRDPRTTHLVSGRLRCGRCGGSLSTGDRTEEYRFVRRDSQPEAELAV
jgi:hypothetical protein